MSTGSFFFDRGFRRPAYTFVVFVLLPADFRQLLRSGKQFFHKTVICIILMVLYHGQDVFQIVERTQVIRLCGFCNAVDDRTGFCAVYTIDQLPCMFVQGRSSIF